jgi:hypothetical protein
MIRVSPRERYRGVREPATALAHRTDIPLAMVLAWIAALVITTEGLMTFQSLYG